MKGILLFTFALYLMRRYHRVGAGNFTHGWTTWKFSFEFGGESASAYLLLMLILYKVLILSKSINTEVCLEVKEVEGVWVRKKGVISNVIHSIIIGRQKNGLVFLASKLHDIVPPFPLLPLYLIINIVITSSHLRPIVLLIFLSSSPW